MSNEKRIKRKETIAIYLPCFCLLLIALFAISSLSRAEEEDLTPKGTAYPEEKFYEASYSTREKAKEALESLYMKSPSPEKEVDLKEIERTFFSEGTTDKAEEDYLKEAEENRWEEWFPLFFEFGKVLKEEGKEIYHELLFPKKFDFKEGKR